MSKTYDEVAARALEHIGVLSLGENATDEEAAYAVDTLEGLVSEIRETHGIDVTGGAALVQDVYYLTMAKLLGIEISPRFTVPQVDARHTLIARIRAIGYPDDRRDRRDIDENGTITSDESEAAARAAFY